MTFEQQETIRDILTLLERMADLVVLQGKRIELLEEDLRERKEGKEEP